MISGKVAPWTGRFYSLLDPSYAKNNIPIIASVSEHQPTSWSSFYFDLQILTILFPAGKFFWPMPLTRDLHKNGKIQKYFFLPSKTNDKICLILQSASDFQNDLLIS